MGIFKSKKSKDNTERKENRKEALYKRKKGNRVVRKVNKYPIISSMKLSKIRPTSVIDYINNNQNGILKQIEGIFEKDNGVEKGYLVIALAESDLKKITDNSQDKESIGLFINSINKDMIKSASLSKNLDKGFIVLVPSNESIELLGDHEEIVEYEEGFHLGIFPDDISDSQTDSKEVYILDNRVTYKKLLELSGKSEENSSFELKNISYDGNGVIEKAHIITIDGEIVSDVNDSLENDDSNNSDKLVATDFSNTYDSGISEIKDISEDTADKDKVPHNDVSEETVEMSTEFFDDTLGSQEKNSNDVIAVNATGVNNVLKSRDASGDSSVVTEKNSEVKSEKDIQTSQQTDDISTEKATQVVDFVKDKIRAFDKTPEDLGVTLSLEDISYLFISADVPFLTLTDDVSDNELEKVLNAKRKLANDQLKQVHLDNVQKIVDTYMEKSDEAIIKIREATSLDDITNRLGKKKQELDNKYDYDRKEIDKNLKQYTENVWEEYNTEKKQVVESAVVQAKISFDEANKRTAEQKIARRERELYATIDSSFENSVARLKAERLEEVKRLFGMINSDTIDRLRGMYSKFQKTERDMADQYRQEIEKFSDKYWQNELERQKTLRDKLKNDSTIEELQAKLANLESTKIKLISDNEKAMEKLVVGNKKHLKDITEQFDEENSRRRNEFLEKERQYTEEITRQNNQIIKLRKEYEELQSSSQKEKAKLENIYQEEKIKYMRDADYRIREELDRMNNESKERERTYTEKFKQKDIETRRVVKSTRLTATIGMIAALLFGISIPIVGDKVLSEYNLFPKESRVSSVSTVASSSERISSQESTSELQNNSSSANEVIEKSSSSQNNNSSQDNSPINSNSSEAK